MALFFPKRSCINSLALVWLRSLITSATSDKISYVDGVVNCRVIDKPNYLSNSNFSDFEISDKDTLFNQGYNVNCIDNLPEPQRQCILRQILENKELSKSGICSYIDTLISRGEKELIGTML